MWPTNKDIPLFVGVPVIMTRHVYSMADPDSSLAMSNKYPMVKTVFTEFNTSLPSSVAVERYLHLCLISLFIYPRKKIPVPLRISIYRDPCVPGVQDQTGAIDTSSLHVDANVYSRCR